jgi:UDP-sugar transporter A1/2/3
MQRLSSPKDAGMSPGAKHLDVMESSRDPVCPLIVTEKPASAAAPAGEPCIAGVPMKWVSLVSLTAQTSAQVFVIKWARQGVSETNGGSGHAYLASTIVLFTEILKTLVSFLLVAMETGGVGPAAASVRKQFSGPAFETLQISVPSLLYTVQNNLMFFSLLKLSAAVQQVTYQLKILTTALLSVLLLGKSLDTTKWSALFVLLGGVLLVQWPRGGDNVVSDADGGLESLLGGIGQDALLGFGAVLVACFTSGFASVYLEKLLKQTKASIWMRNVQLGLFGAATALLVCLSQDGDRILKGGFLQGYSPRVLCVVVTNALGGLLCAAVLKYADNILRCFSTALSIILTCVLSAAVLHEYTPDLLFVVGASLAISATFLYNLGVPQWMTVTPRKVAAR